MRKWKGVKTLRLLPLTKLKNGEENTRLLKQHLLAFYDEREIAIRWNWKACLRAIKTFKFERRKKKYWLKENAWWNLITKQILKWLLKRNHWVMKTRRKETQNVILKVIWRWTGTKMTRRNQMKIELAIDFKRNIRQIKECSPTTKILRIIS